jgi:hypothetical protein
MTNRPYTGTKDAPGTATRKGTTELLRLAQKRWNVTNKGSFNPRLIQSGTSKGKPSTHGTGRAIDLGYRSRTKALEFWDFLIAHTEQLQIEAIHDYAYETYGRGYRCSRGSGTKGVRTFTAKNNAGSIGGRWLHVELSPHMADNPQEFRKAWIACLRAAGLN